MRRIETLDEAEKVLSKYRPKARDILGKDISLDRMRIIMRAIGNPEKSLKVIHIAGTSGKTSTSYFISSLLTLAGKKTGLTVSPHVDLITERLQINGKPVGEKEFCSSLNEFLEEIENSDIEPTYFEILVALAYWYFAKEKVDYAVIETGLGGILDGTNVAERKDKICVITDIGFDHMHVLGNTIKQIAAQKAGIIQEGNLAIMYSQSEEINKVFMDYAKTKNASLISIDPVKTSAKLDQQYNYFSTLPLFQQRNWTLAYEAFKLITDRDNLTITEQNIEKSMRVSIPGRMDIVKIGNKVLVLDGAHNEQKVKAFVESFKKQFPNIKVPILTSMREKKEFVGAISHIIPIASEVILTTFSVLQDRHNVSTELSKMAEVLKEKGCERVIIESNQDKAYKKFLDSVKDVGVITGSFFLISQLRKGHEELRNG